MGEMVQALARERGIHTLYLNAVPTAVAFYERTGWSRYVWSEKELASLPADCVQMQKEI